MVRKNYKRVDCAIQNLPPANFEPSPPVLVVGMHNAGTSILTEIIHRCGIFMCPDMDHHECRFWTHFLHDDLILGSHEKWSDLPLMSVEDVLALEPIVGEFAKKYWMADYIKFGYDGISPWGFKDPRICIFLPLYLKLFPDAKVVQIHRNQDDIAASLTRRPKPGLGIETQMEFWKKLTAAYVDRANEYVPKFKNHHVLEYEQLCTNKEEVIKPLMEFLDLPLENATPEILRKLSPKRIGSHKRYLQSGSWGKLKREVMKRVYAVVRPEISGR